MNVFHKPKCPDTFCLNFELLHVCFFFSFCLRCVPLLTFFKIRWHLFVVSVAKVAFFWLTLKWRTETCACVNRVFGVDVQGRDCGDDVSNWLTRYLESDNSVRLVHFEPHLKARRPSEKEPLFPKDEKVWWRALHRPRTTNNDFVKTFTY